MRTLITFVLGLATGGLLTTGVTARQSLLADAETRDAVVAVKQAIVQGHRIRDVAALSRLYGEDYTAIDARGTVRTIHDPVAGEFKIPGMPIKTSDYPADAAYVAPTLGQHNAAILGGLLGKSAADIEALCASGVLRTAPT